MFYVCLLNGSFSSSINILRIGPVGVSLFWHYDSDVSPYPSTTLSWSVHARVLCSSFFFGFHYYPHVRHGRRARLYSPFYS